MPRYCCTCTYDGTAYSGWQIQPGAPTVQEIIQTRLSNLLGAPTTIHGSGRTDAGVHARAQVFHFEGEWAHPLPELLRALQSNMPSDVRVTSLQTVPESFHARYSAINKRYTYQLLLGYANPFNHRYYWALGKQQLKDTAAMQAAAELLTGTHNFAAFSAKRGNESDADTVRELRRLSITSAEVLDTLGKPVPSLTLTMEAKGFLYKMVRGLTGALVSVGLGRNTPKAIAQLLETGQRGNTFQMAPPQGLCLEFVQYPEEFNISGSPHSANPPHN